MKTMIEKVCEVLGLAKNSALVTFQVGFVLEGNAFGFGLYVQSYGKGKKHVPSFSGHGTTPEEAFQEVMVDILRWKNPETAKAADQHLANVSMFDQMRQAGDITDEEHTRLVVSSQAKFLGLGQ